MVDAASVHPAGTAAKALKLDITQHRPRADDGLGLSFASVAASVALWSARSAPAPPADPHRP
eukprot:3897634-Prorocentrum_lima.AAC.1